MAHYISNRQNVFKPHERVSFLLFRLRWDNRFNQMANTCMEKPFFFFDFEKKRKDAVCWHKYRCLFRKKKGKSVLHSEFWQYIRKEWWFRHTVREINFGGKEKGKEPCETFFPFLFVESLAIRFDTNSNSRVVLLSRFPKILSSIFQKWVQMLLLYFILQKNERLAAAILVWVSDLSVVDCGSRHHIDIYGWRRIGVLFRRGSLRNCYHH